MPKDLRNFTLVTAILVGIIFLNSIHAVITPFILAAMLAYLFTPLVSWCQQKLKLPRLAAVAIVFIVLMAILSAVAVNVTMRIAEEQDDLALTYKKLNLYLIHQNNVLPAWAKPLLASVNGRMNFGTLFSPQRLWPYFSGALSGVGSLFVFLVATFYFMKDGSRFFESVLGFIMSETREKTDKITEEINTVLNSYLRGQMLLVILMSCLSLIALTILNVKYAFLLAIFTGIAEIVPLIGPVVAASVAALVSLLDNRAMFSLTPAAEAVAILIIYFVLRQLEDQIVIPVVMGKATKLHPLLILFLVLIGGHIWGVFGMILAVPLAAVARVIFIHTRS
jgi:predicted PurR-regulated permease PerM